MTDAQPDSFVHPASPPARSRRTRILVVVVAVALGGLAALTGDPRLDDAAADPGAAADGSGGASDASLPPVLHLLAHRQDDGVLDMVVLVGVDDGDERGSGVLVPPPTLIEVPALGATALSEIAAGPDTTALVTALSNAFGVHIDAAAVFDDETLTAALAPAGSIEVDLHRPIRIEDDRGALAFAEGRQEISSADAMRLLTADTGEGEIDRLVVVQAVLDGWASALQDEAVLWPTLEAAPALAALARYGGAEARWSTLPVTRLIAAADDEIFGIEREEVSSLMREAFGYALLGDGGARPRVELLNGTGGVGVTSAVAALIVPAGGEITLTGNVPGFGVAETTVVYYKPEGRGAAQMVLDALGVGTLALADQPLGVVDVTVVIGEDLAGVAQTDDEVEGVDVAETTEPATEAPPTDDEVASDA